MVIQLDQVRCPGNSETANGKTIGIGQYIHEIRTGGDRTEQERMEYEARLRNKIKQGRKLTEEEKKYVRDNMPELYPIVLRQERMHRQVEQTCANCRSKQEVQEAYTQALESISKNDPQYEYMVAAVEDAFKEFKNSKRYQALPVKAPQEKEAQKEHAAIREARQEVCYMPDAKGYQEAYVDMTDSSYNMLR